jgi:NACHT domain
MLNRIEAVISNQNESARNFSTITNTVQQAAVFATTRGDLSELPERDLIISMKTDEERFKARVEDSVLDALSFSAMSDRIEEVSEAHNGTFEWIFRDKVNQSQPWSNFVDWLQRGTGVYWVNGKAGSGKSTLMRYIYDHPKTREELRVWAGQTPLVIAGHFFWNSGSPEQRSQLGLLRSLLYKALHQCRDLIPVIFPSLWAKTYSRTLAPSASYERDSLSLKKSMQAFTVLLKQTSVPIKLCLFIDGLDEYEGNHSNIVDLLTDLTSSSHVKVCASSRPLLVFEDGFSAFPRLRLQDLTFKDINNYTNDNLRTNKRFQQLLLKEPVIAPALVEEIVAKADGVFLWVRLVVESLLQGLGNRDEISDLQRRLRFLPVDLEALYKQMLTARIDPVYLHRASMIFQIVREARAAGEVKDALKKSEVQGETTAWSAQNASEVGVEESSRLGSKPLTILALAFADLQNYGRALVAPVKPLSDMELISICQVMEDGLKSWCAGLLEIQGSDTESLHADSSVAKVNGKVQYLHRTVRVFLEKPEVWNSLVSNSAGTDFDPNICLLISSILLLKTVPVIRSAKLLWRTVIGAMDYAFGVKSASSNAHVDLLDQLDSTMVYLAQRSSLSYIKHRARYRGFGYGNDDDCQDSFLALAVQYGLCAYVDAKLKADNSLIHRKQGRPLLDYVVGSAQYILKYVAM